MFQSFGQVVHSLRLKKGFTSARKAAIELKISNVYLHEIEGDIKTPSNEVIERMANLYGVDPVYLVSLVASNSKTKKSSTARLEVARYIMSMSDDEFDDFQASLSKKGGGH